jgi:hypothetical protein
MSKGKTLGGLGIGVVLSTVAGILLAKKKKNILDIAQKNFGSLSGLLKSLTSCVTEPNKKEVT